MSGFVHLFYIYPSGGATGPYVPPTPPLTLNMAESAYSPPTPAITLNMNEGA